MANIRKAPALGNLNSCETIAVYTVHGILMQIGTRLGNWYSSQISGKASDITTLREALNILTISPFEIGLTKFHHPHVPEVNSLRTYFSNMRSTTFADPAKIRTYYFNSDYTGALIHAFRLENGTAQDLQDLYNELWYSFITGQRTATSRDEYSFDYNTAAPASLDFKRTTISAVTVKLVPSFKVPGNLYNIPHN